MAVFTFSKYYIGPRLIKTTRELSAKNTICSNTSYPDAVMPLTINFLLSLTYSELVSIKLSVIGSSVTAAILESSSALNEQAWNLVGDADVLLKYLVSMWSPYEE